MAFMSSPSTSVAGITGTPASMATRRALALSPSARMVSAFGPMKAMPGRVAGIHEIGVLRQQAVARVDRVGAAHLGDADDLGDGEIGRDRAQPLADLVGLVGLEPVEAQLVLLGVDRDRPLAQLVGRAHDADRDFAAVGDEDLLELGHEGGLPFAIAECLRGTRRARNWKLCRIGEGEAPPRGQTPLGGAGAFRTCVFRER
jgi:hypothetical protein